MLLLHVQTVGSSEGWVTLVLFYLFAALSGVSAWALVLSPNIIRMAVYLMLTLAGVAGIYFLLGAELLAAVQLIVYVGGVLILIIFGVMLTSRNPYLNVAPRGGEMALGLVLATVLAVLLAVAVLAAGLPEAAAAAPDDDRYAVRWIGALLLSRHLIAFEVAAVILLIVMIGAGYLVRRRIKANQAGATEGRS
ncbi:MAG: NADH-quinone oxidoreductase subunit J [Phycisphaeraceae bacterium]|nr:NADH-quinone oxidoreductase subunit J [Phycisphaeraceae bacterium]